MSDSGNDRTILVDRQDDSIINDRFIVDQTSNQIARFDHSGNWLSTIIGMNNVRGLKRIGNEMWLAHDGEGHGATADTIRRYDLSGSFLGDFAIANGSGSPWGIENFNGEVLITDSGTDNIERYDTSGNWLGTFHDSDGIAGIDFPQGIHAFNNEIFVAGFSVPAGVFRYNASGIQTGYWDLTNSVRDVYLLGNGEMLAIGGTRMDSLNVATGNITSLFNTAGYSFQKAAEFNPVPEPMTMGVIAVGALALLRRKKKS